MDTAADYFIAEAYWYGGGAGRYLLCRKCAPYWWVARPIADVGVVITDGRNFYAGCYFCLAGTAENFYRLYELGGTTISVCDDCLKTRLADAADAARRARKLADGLVG